MSKQSIVETVGGVTTEVTESGVTVTQSDGLPLSSQALDVVNVASTWAGDNPRTAVVIAGVATVATATVAYQLIKKLVS